MQLALLIDDDGRPRWQIGWHDDVSPYDEVSVDQPRIGAPRRAGGGRESMPGGTPASGSGEQKQIGTRATQQVEKSQALIRALKRSRLGCLRSRVWPRCESAPAAALGADRALPVVDV